jgi:DNA-binding response OmpR family regulator/signal transduction histidine kinase
MNTILLVEDTRELAKLIRTELESNGYIVTLAEDGEQALKFFTGQHPDLVILDWMLPKVDGLEVLRRIRQNSAVPVLMLTARREETDRVIGLEVGADDYLTKPFGMRELVARVHAQLRRSEMIQSVLSSDKAGHDAPFSCGPLTLDPPAYSAVLNGQPLDLTRTEFNLLSLLARNRDVPSAVLTFRRLSGAACTFPATARWIMPYCACAVSWSQWVIPLRLSGASATVLTNHEQPFPVLFAAVIGTPAARIGGSLSGGAAYPRIHLTPGRSCRSVCGANGHVLPVWKLRHVGCSAHPTPDTGWFWRSLSDGLTGMILSLVMLFGIWPSGSFLKWDAIWRLTSWSTDQIIMVFCFTGIGFFFARIFVRLWLRWNAMRKRRMLWTITNAHLMVAIAFALIFIVIFFLVTPYSSTAARILQETRDPMASVATSLLVTFFPVLSLIVIGLVATLSVILPPSAVFSYFVSRRITRRLESLTKTTAALRAGDYTARVTVDGEDEIARLQSDFNAMADRLSTTLRDLNTEKNNTAQILQSRRDLIASVSHELRTPVATLRAAIETMLDRWDNTPPDENRRKVALMESEIHQLSGLIDDLFTLSQSDVDNLSLDCAPTDLLPLVKEVVDGFSPLAWQSGRWRSPRRCRKNYRRRGLIHAECGRYC